VAFRMIYDGFVDHEVGVLQFFWPGSVEAPAAT
jgi:hypothetical protein